MVYDIMEAIKSAWFVILVLKCDVFAFYLACFMSHIIRKPDFCLCENKDTDQLRSNCEADQRLYFRYSYSTIPPLLVPKISSL